MDNSRLCKLLSYLEKNKADSFLIFAIAKEYETQNKPEKALKYYLQLKESDPDYIGLYYHLAKLYEEIEEFILAINTYKEGMNLANKKGDFHAMSELSNAKINLEMEMGN